VTVAADRSQKRFGDNCQTPAVRSKNTGTSSSTDTYGTRCQISGSFSVVAGEKKPVTVSRFSLSPQSSPENPKDVFKNTRASGS